MNRFIVYRDSALGNYRAIEISAQEVERFRPCIEYVNPSVAEATAKHLNGVCGRHRSNCPVCLEEMKRALAKQTAREREAEGQYGCIEEGPLGDRDRRQGGSLPDDPPPVAKT